MQVKEIKYFDDETLDLVAERFFIDKDEVSAEDYYDLVGGLGNNYCEDVEDDNEEEICDGECDHCSGCIEVEGITYEELLDIFVERLQETGGCPHCIKHILNEFAEIVGEE